MSWRLIEGDCIEQLAELETESIDAICTDPPYGLEFMGKEWDRLGATNEAASDSPGWRAGHGGSGNASKTNGVPFGGGGQRVRYGTSAESMQGWHEAWAVEALRVLKPGGHLLAFGGPRTYHRLACAIEDAGFEIRDSLMWMFGSGFPKSLDVSKAIDKTAGVEGTWRQEDHPGRAGVRKRTDSSSNFGQTDYGAEGNERHVYEAESDEARAWQGWGTALKPAYEIVVVGVKPDPESERDRIYASLCLLGNKIASLSPANPAVQSSGSSPAEHDAAVLASARWTADERDSTRVALCAQMDTSQFESAITSSLNIVSSWLLTLDELSNQESTFITETGSETTTALKTLSCCLSEITPVSIIEALMSLGGASLDALPVAQAFAAVESRLSATRRLSAIESAIGQGRISRLDEDGLLRPDAERIVLARKPLAGTVAANVLEHGTGAINVDGCRVPVSDEDRDAIDGRDYVAPSERTAYSGFEHDGTRRSMEYAEGGRWPANVVMDPEAGELLDEQFGERAAGNHPARRSGREDEKVYGSGWSAGTEGDRRPTDSGGASRFFYAAKTARGERDAGLDDLEVKPLNWSSGEQNPGSFQSEGTEKAARNHHPTVKPIQLMRWLVRMVTPPGGTVLDLFAGSGSTGCAAVLEGVDFIGIERDPEYIEIARRRIEFWAQHEGAVSLDAVLGGAQRERKARDAGQLGLLDPQG